MSITDRIRNEHIFGSYILIVRGEETVAFAAAAAAVVIVVVLLHISFLFLFY